MPPHWIFAFDDFLKCTVMTSTEFLCEPRADESVCDAGESVAPSLQQSISMTSSEIDSGVSISKYRKVSHVSISEYLTIQAPTTHPTSNPLTTKPDKNLEVPGSF